MNTTFGLTRSSGWCPLFRLNYSAASKNPSHFALDELGWQILRNYPYKKDSLWLQIVIESLDIERNPDRGDYTAI